MAARRGSRFLTFLIVAIASLALTGSFASVAYADLVATQIEDDTPIATQADYGARITPPSSGTICEVGKAVTVKVTAKYHKVDSSLLNSKPNYIYLKITRDGIRQDYLNQTITSPWAVEQDRTASFSFKPSTEGEYLIEAHQDWNFDGDNHIDLAYESFTKDSSITITVQKDISKAETVVSGLVDKAYTGQALTQDLAIAVDGKTLDRGTDYDVAYADNVNVGTATVTITGKGFYKGTVTKNFNVTAADITKATVSGIVDKDYSNTAATQTPRIVLGAVLLVEDTDYVLSYENNSNAGTASVIITGIGNYSGSITKSFTINKVSVRELSDPTLQAKAWTGEPITQSISLWHGRNLVEGQDFTVSYKNNVDPGAATVTITGIGNYKGTKTRTFSIIDISGEPDGLFYIASPKDKIQYPVGTQITPKISVGLAYASGTNYFHVRVSKDGKTLSYNHYPYTDVGTYTLDTINATSKGTYLIEARCTYNSSPNLAEESFTAQTRATVYVGFSGPGALHDISTVTVTGLTDKQYTGNSITHSPTVKFNGTTLKNGTDYYLTYSNNLHTGKATVTIRGKGSYTGYVSKQFTITPKPLTASMVKLAPASFTYNGELQKPQVSVIDGDAKLMNPANYTAVNDGGTVPGQYQVTVKASNGGDYSGTITKSYTIAKPSLSKAIVTCEPANFIYDGQAKEPAVTVVLDGAILSPDVYNVTYINNRNAGTAQVRATAKAGGNYEGSASGSFAIEQYSIAQDTVSVSPIDDVTFNRQAQTPKPQVMWGETVLGNPADYTLSYENNRDVGTAKVTIQGVGNFKGSRTLTFAIKKKDINDGSITVEPLKYQLYNEGTPSTPEITVKDGGAKLAGDEFAVEYANNDALGTATATITGIGNYTGTRTAIEFQIFDAQTYATTELTDAIDAIEGASIGGYLQDDKKALQAAIDAAKALLADGNATVEDLEQALASIRSIEGTAKANKAAYEKAKKEALTMPSAAEVSKQIFGQKTDKDPSGSEFMSLKLKCIKQGKSYNVLNWNKVSGASRYVVYGSQCGKSNKIKKIATVKGNTYKHKKLKKGTYYKYVVVAIKDTVIGERVAATSKMIHVATKGGTVGNAKKVTIKVKSGKTAKAVKAIAIKKGKTKALAATSTPVSSKLTVKKHVGLRYASTNTKVAKVSSKGVIKGVGKGACYVFVYAQNGVAAKIKVTIK